MLFVLVGGGNKDSMQSLLLIDVDLVEFELESEMAEDISFDLVEFVFGVEDFGDGLELDVARLVVESLVLGTDLVRFHLYVTALAGSLL